MSKGSNGVGLLHYNFVDSRWDQKFTSGLLYQCEEEDWGNVDSRAAVKGSRSKKKECTELISFATECKHKREYVLV